MPVPAPRVPRAARLVGALLAAVLLGLAAAPPAQARVRVFLGFGPGYWGPGYWGPPAYYYPPPIYYPPPVYYPPAPPVVFTPPADQAGPPAGAQSCDAGAYVCPLERTLPVGATCWCRDNTGRRAYGRAR